MEVTRGGAVGLGTAPQTGRSRVLFPMLSPEFFIDIILPAPQWAIVMKSGSLNLSERSGPVQGLICLLWRLTAFICCEATKRGRGAGIVSVVQKRVETTKRRNGENRAVSFIKNMQSTSLVSCWSSLQRFAFKDETVLRKCLRRGLKYEAVHIAGDIGCRVRNKWLLAGAWITKKREIALNAT
jgi:hypothetical protein